VSQHHAEAAFQALSETSRAWSIMSFRLIFGDPLLPLAQTDRSYVSSYGNDDVDLNDFATFLSNFTG